MAEEYSGINLKVMFKGADISGQGRKITVTENAPIPPDIDVSHKGDSEVQVVEGLAGARTTDASIETVDIYDAITALGSVALNTKDTLVVYPYGKTHTYPVLTLQNFTSPGSNCSATWVKSSAIAMHGPQLGDQKSSTTAPPSSDITASISSSVTRSR